MGPFFVVAALEQLDLGPGEVVVPLAFKNSALSLPLKLSFLPFCQGATGLMKRLSEP